MVLMALGVPTEATLIGGITGTVGAIGAIGTIAGTVLASSGQASAPMGNITIISPIEDGAFWRNRVNTFVAKEVNNYNIRMTRSFAV